MTLSQAIYEALQKLETDEKLHPYCEIVVKVRQNQVDYIDVKTTHQVKKA